MSFIFMSFNYFMSFNSCSNCKKHWDKIRSLNTNFRSNKKLQSQLHWHQRNQYVIQSLNAPNSTNLFIMRVDIIKVCARILFNGGNCQKATRLHDLFPIFPTQNSNHLFMYKWGVRSYSTKNFHKNWRLKNFQCKKQKIRLG